MRMKNKWTMLSAIFISLTVIAVGLGCFIVFEYESWEIVEVEYQRSDDSLIWGQDCQVIRWWTLNLLNNTQRHWLSIWLMDNNYENTQVSVKINNCSTINSEWIEDQWIDIGNLVLQNDSYWRQEYYPEIRIGFIWVHIRAYYDCYYIQTETFQRIML